MNSRICTPFYVFFLNPDYVAARSLRSLRSNNWILEFHTPYSQLTGILNILNSSDICREVFLLAVSRFLFPAR